MAKDKPQSPSATLTAEIVGLNDYVTPVGMEEPFVLRDEPAAGEEKGKPRPMPEQFTIGNILVGLVSNLAPPADKPHMVMIHQEVCKRLREAMKKGGTIVVGEAMMGIIRAALKANKRAGPGGQEVPIYPPAFLPDVWRAVGAGDLPELPKLDGVD